MSQAPPMASNQGRVLDQILLDVAPTDLEEAGKAGWLEFRRHPADASCECPAMEILARLYELGYRLIKAPESLA